MAPPPAKPPPPPVPQPRAETFDGIEIPTSDLELLLDEEDENGAVPVLQDSAANPEASPTEDAPRASTEDLDATLAAIEDDDDDDDFEIDIDI